MSSVYEITNQLRACCADSMRAILEPDDAKTLLAYLESQGFMSPEGAEAAVYARFLKSKGVLPEHVQTQEEQDALKTEYAAFRVEHPDPIEAMAVMDKAEVKAKGVAKK